MAQIVETLQTRKFQTAIPGVYSDRSTAQPTGPAVEQGVVGLISASEFTRLKPYTPTLVSSDAAFKQAIPVFGKRHSAAMWAPGDANEPDVGRPSQFYLVNAAPSTRGSLTLTNGDGNVLTVYARIYGLDSNKIKMTLGSGTNKGQKLTLTYEDQVWVTDDIGGDNIMGIGYAGTEASTMTAAVHPTNGVTIAYTKTSALTAAGPVDSYTPDDMAFDGTVTVTLDQNPGTGVTVEVTITGTNKATGAALVEVLSFVGDSGVYTKTTSGSFSAVTTIARTNSSGGWGAATTAAISGNAFALPIADYDTVQDVIDRINTFSAATFSATDAFGDAATRLIASMDVTAATTIKGTVTYYKANLDFLAQAFGDDEADTPTLPIHPSGLVIGTKAASATGTATNFSTARYLVGGASGAQTYTVGGTWDLALQSLRDIDLNECWIDQHVTDGDTDGEGILARVLVEFDRRHGEGRRETHLHVATSAQPTKAIAKTTVVNVNRDYATVYCNETKYRDELNVPRWWAPKYMALRAACAAAGLPRLGMTLTNKRMAIEDVRDGGSNWSFVADGEELVRAGLALVSKDVDRGGFKVVRWLSAYRASADPLRTQSSTVRAMNACTQDLRRFAAYVIGQTNYDGTAAALKAALIGRLTVHRDQFKWIKSFNPSNLVLTDAGTTFTLDATNINPVEPIDFVYLKPEFARTITIL